MAQIDENWDPETLAAEMEQQGYSAEHVRRSTGVDILRLEPPPRPGDERDEGRASLRARARELRRNGATLVEVAEQLGVSRSTAYHWTREMVEQRPTEAWRRREEKILAAQALRRRGLLQGGRRSSRRLSRDRLRLDLRRATAGWRQASGRAQRGGDVGDEPEAMGATHRRPTTGNVSGRGPRRRRRWDPSTRGISCCSERWPTGARGARRSLGPAGREQVRFVNSDPALVRLFLHFLAAAGVQSWQVQYRLSIHESADVAGAQRYWAELVGRTPESFMAPTLKRHKPKTSRHNTGDHYRGCLNVQVLNARRVYWRIDGLMRGLDALLRVVASSPPPPDNGGPGLAYAVP